MPKGVGNYRVTTVVTKSKQKSAKASSIITSPIVAFGSSFYLFGGYDGGSIKTIAGFDTNTKQWKKLGYLNQGRRGHGLIVHQGQFIVVGGYKGSLATERCILKGDSIQCTTDGPELDDYYFYPELMSVPENYCPK